MTKHLTPVNELGLKYKRPHIERMPKLVHTIDVIDYLHNLIDKDIMDLKEYCWVALLTANNNLLGISEVSSGTIHSCDMNIREILQVALLTNAATIIVIHNHPCGDLNPSPSDVRLTRELATLCQHMMIHLADHIIVTSEGYKSIKKMLNF